jgi:hypothetical protein
MTHPVLKARTVVVVTLPYLAMQRLGVWIAALRRFLWSRSLKMNLSMSRLQRRL